MYIIINFYSNYGTLLYTKILLESCKNLYTLSCCVTLWMLSCHGLCGIGINPIPLIVSKKTYTFPQILGKNGFHFLHSSLHCLGMKGFCYCNNKKRIPILTKRTQERIQFLWVVPQAPLLSTLGTALRNYMLSFILLSSLLFSVEQNTKSDRISIRNEW